MHAKEQLEIMFMINPRMPVSLIVNISAKDTINATKNEVSGPKSRPLIAIIMSFGSYFKKGRSEYAQQLPPHKQWHITYL